MSTPVLQQRLKLARFIRGLRTSSPVALPYALVMLALVAVISPVGNFPLNDDWVYMEMVRELVENQTFYEHPYRGSLAITIVGWGWLAATIFGLSFTVLRCSTLVLALVALCATTKAALEHGLPRPLAFLCGALLLANPLFLNLTYTFMNDVPCLAAASCAGMFYMRALTHRSPWAAFWGSTFVVLGSATRQDGVVVIGAFLATEVVSWLARARKPELGMLGGFAIPLILGGILYTIAFSTSSEEAFNNLPEAATKPSLLSSWPDMIFEAGAALIYIGLFTLPIGLAKLFAVARGHSSRTRGQWIAFAGLCAGLQLTVTSMEGEAIALGGMPLLPNVLYDLGVGPLTLRDVFAMGAEGPAGLGNGWWLVHLLALCSMSLLLVDVFPLLARHVSRVRTRSFAPSDDQHAPRARMLFLVLWIGAIVLLPYRLVTEMLYDRYLLPALFPAVILAAQSLTPAAKIDVRVAWIGTGLAFIFALVGVQDYLAWNSARWEAIDYLRHERNVGATEIDGGYEYNGMYLSAEFRRRNDVSFFSAQGPGRFWLLEETRYAIYLNDMPGCRRLKKFSYFSWLRLEPQQVLAVHCDSE
jgi:hypothetical protein